MQRARSVPWNTVTIATLGLALTGAWVMGVLTLTLSRGYETSAPFVLVPIFIAVSLPALRAQARREASSTLLWLLVAALVLKLASAFVREYVAFGVYGGAADAANYHAEGVRISEAFRDGNFTTGLHSLTSTNYIRFFTGVVYTVIGASRLGGFLFYSWLGFWGLFLFYRAATVALPEGGPRTYATLVFFLPSLLFWPSSIGKEAWMLFALGIAAYGAALILSRATLRGLAYAGSGLWLAAIVRPHVAGMMAIALAVGYLLRRPKEELRQLAPIAKALSLAILTVVALFLVVRTERFIEEAGIDTTGGVTSVIEGVTERTASGGSEFTPSPVLGSPLSAPVGIVTVLFRPFPFEATNAQGLAVALEGTFLLVLTILRIRWAWGAFRSARRQPYVAFAVVYSALFAVGFSGVANFGLLSRERVQLLPLYLVLFSIPPRRGTEIDADARDERDAAPLTPHGRGVDEPGPATSPAGTSLRDRPSDEGSRELEATVRELEETLQRIEARIEGPASGSVSERNDRDRPAP